jgi:CelD/BcsL family acetyltransferase involved in cellulose biosynthesis
MIKEFITTIKRRLGLIPKDFSIGGYDYKRMMASNSARNGENTSAWAPGALKRLEKKQRKERRSIDKKSMVYLAEQRMKDKRRPL